MKINSNQHDIYVLYKFNTTAKDYSLVEYYWVYRKVTFFFFFLCTAEVWSAKKIQLGPVLWKNEMIFRKTWYIRNIRSYTFPSCIHKTQLRVRINRKFLVTGSQATRENYPGRD